MVEGLLAPAEDTIAAVLNGRKGGGLDSRA